MFNQDKIATFKNTMNTIPQDNPVQLLLNMGLTRKTVKLFSKPNAYPNKNILLPKYQVPANKP